MSEKSQPVQDSSFWLLKFQQNLSMRRGTVYRFLASSLQLLMFGNAGGIGLILGIFPSGKEPPGVHWICVVGIIAFMLGCLAAAGTIFAIGALTLKEANAAESALAKLIEQKISFEDAVLYIDKKSFAYASGAMVCGLGSLVFLTIGAITAVTLLALYY